jgi:DNA polymerase III subunit gamma/tau
MESLKFNDIYRPKTFAEVVGQAENLKILDNSIKTNQVQNAYIFFGAPGTGKTTVARIFANKLICSHLDDDNEPCGNCEACKTFKENPYTAGVIEIDGASNANINEIRALKTTVGYSPRFKYNVVIIDEVQDVKGPGASALLKILEEPPADTVFILATTDYEAILKAMRTRCMQLHFELVKPADIKKKLLDVCFKQGIDMSPRAIDLLAEGVDGCVRDALRILQQASLLSNKNIKERSLVGLVDMEFRHTEELLKYMLLGNVEQLISYIYSNIPNVTKGNFDSIAKQIRKLFFRKLEVKNDVRRALINIVNIFLRYKADITLYSNTLMALEFAVMEGLTYLDENVSINDRTMLVDLMDKEDNIVINKDFIKANKKDLFMDVLYALKPSVSELFDKFEIHLESEGTVIKFLTETQEQKLQAREILMAEEIQRLKDVFDIAFIAKTKEDEKMQNLQDNSEENSNFENSVNLNNNLEDNNIDNDISNDTSNNLENDYLKNYSFDDNYIDISEDFGDNT